MVIEPLAVEEEDVVADAQLTGAVCRASGHDVRQYWREVGRRVRMAVDVLDRDPEGAFLEQRRLEHLHARREGISGNQWQSEAIRGNQRQSSEVLR